MKKTIILAFAVLLTASSCGNKSQKNNAADQTENTEITEKVEMLDDGHNTQNSVSYAGTYKGTIPCADCPGIDLVITLDYDDLYTKKMTYQGKEPNNVFTSSGKFSWDNNGSIITLTGKGDGEKFFVTVDAIIMLDAEGKEIKGPNAGMYRITKTE
jgi:uncharacterized lipoprotein NlpE involved in copper resistance